MIIACDKMAKKISKRPGLRSKNNGYFMVPNHEFCLEFDGY